MARWRLRQAHYLKVPGTQWEYKVAVTGSNKSARQMYDVPMFLDPNDPECFNYPQMDQRGMVIGGEVIVAHAANPAFPRDIIFTGLPTPDMEPIDDEAKEISRRESSKWVHPIESLPERGFSQVIMTELEKKIDAIAQGSGNSVSLAGATSEETKRLQGLVEQLIQQNSMLMQQLAAKSEPQARRA